MSVAGRARDADRGPEACVLGDMDLVRPLGLAGIRCAVVAAPHRATRYSRFTTAAIDRVDPVSEPEELLRRLLAHAAGRRERPVLFYQDDESLLFVSRHRDRLAAGFRFAIDEPERVETLVDKTRFQELAQGLGLPVPAMRLLDPAREAGPPADLRYPLVLKPSTRGDGRWALVERRGKALRAGDRAALEALWPRLAALGAPVLAQEEVPGPETLIESHHAYVDAAGVLVAEFTGRKVRTTPPQYGHTTALTITDAPDVAALGRRVLAALRLRGVAKVDFKRAPDGSLRLLEVNPRFNLWHHPGAVAGVNLPALVWADLAGRPRPAVRRARPGVTWWSAKDLRAARETGLPRRDWARWALRPAARPTLSFDDPLPPVRVALHRLHDALRP